MPINVPVDTSGIAESAMGTVKLAGSFVVIMCILVLVAWFVLMFFKYDVKVLIFSRRSGGASKVFEDKGAYERDRDGVYKFKLFYRKKSISPPSHNLLMSTSKGSFIALLQLSEDEFVPCNLDLTTAKKVEKVFDKEGKVTGNITVDVSLEPVPSDIKLFSALAMKQTRDTYAEQTLMDKILPFAMWGLIIGGSIVIIYLTIKYASGVIPALNSVAKSAQQIAAALRSSGASPN